MDSQQDTQSSKDSQRTRWKQDPEGVRSNILAVALSEFAEHGLSGARMDEIAAKTRTSKRMIYYYFGDKNGLYQSVLEQAYRTVRHGEKELQLDDLSPADALRQLAEFTFEHHRRNPDFIRLVMIENIHHGDYLKNSDEIRALNETAISRVAAIYNKGVAAGVFRKGIVPVAIHWQISALSFFNVSNRMTFSHLFGEDLFDEAGQALLRRHIGDSIVRFVSVD
ncbi:MAG: TetR family transcriptional regulator [Hoeflea sp.]|uniref:TetR/AcrR family transcriptional regulator n=1 Tax=Hoeflea sp. TaxID=1940281 RepID=UPI001D63315F|nr:TetR/AcrR family transcriptional regulator [Hoeflea sp.]MBU4527782.1 TetR family transcriptional regulator [Alphaproteobacteria bacterium]MBU4546183.1 TetR family transcriptional regulator [Alphaproteobacteria bacterium]MBU4553132.1 TetR family transcriptional regulator [Alphaproteobacteria bacterium]MBV1724204.1 TetR family transcriptional regulator [Hoeflea sp.]MBV1759889.1 TetR family transcriptional regulator [Hoeflea sp.]